tara:strand:- start:1025 stop:2509 length:1485 start_codon:yes stop_codon:yes gene_type:complete
MMDLLLVHTNASRDIYQNLNKISQVEPPIWAALLANNIRGWGHSVEILDAECKGITPEQTAIEIDRYKPKLVCFVVYGQQPSASTQNMAGVHQVLKTLKYEYPQYKTLLLGLYPSAVPRKTMEDENTDFVCQGEGPETLLGLLSSDLDNPSHLKRIPGLWYRDDDEIKYNKPAPLIQNLEQHLPGMAWDLLDMKSYRTANWHAMTNDNDTSPFASLYTSLGCPYRCSFCCINAPFGNNNTENGYGKPSFRFWNPNFMINEFDTIADMGIRNIKIADEMFVLYPKHFMKLCELIIDRGYDFNIWAYARVDTVKPTYLDTLKKAGVNWLALGIESGNKNVRQDVIKGKFSQPDIKEVVSTIQQHDISVIGNYIFGLPEDNYETMNQTLDLSMELNCEFSNFYCTMAYPGSQLYLESNSEDLPNTYTGYSQHSYDCKPLPTKYLSSEEVLRFRDEAFYKCYENKSYREFIHKKFGNETIKQQDNMLKIKLKRKLLGD